MSALHPPAADLCSSGVGSIRQQHCSACHIPSSESITADAISDSRLLNEGDAATSGPLNPPAVACLRHRGLSRCQCCSGCSHSAHASGSNARINHRSQTRGTAALQDRMVALNGSSCREVGSGIRVARGSRRHLPGRPVSLPSSEASGRASIRRSERHGSVRCCPHRHTRCCGQRRRKQFACQRREPIRRASSTSAHAPPRQLLEAQIGFPLGSSPSWQLVGRPSKDDKANSAEDAGVAPGRGTCRQQSGDFSRGLQPHSAADPRVRHPSSSRSNSHEFVLYAPQNPSCPITALAARLLDLIRTGGPSDRCAVDIGGTLAKVAFVTESETPATSRTAHWTQDIARADYSQCMAQSTAGGRRRTRSLERARIRAAGCDSRDRPVLQGRQQPRRTRERRISSQCQECVTGDHVGLGYDKSVSIERHVAPTSPLKVGARLSATNNAGRESEAAPACREGSRVRASLRQEDAAGSCSSEDTAGSDIFGSSPSPSESGAAIALNSSTASSTQTSCASLCGPDGEAGGRRTTFSSSLGGADNRTAAQPSALCSDMRPNRSESCLRRIKGNAGASLTIRATPHHVIRFTYFRTKDVASLLSFLRAYGFAQPGGILRATGGGAHKFGPLFMQKLGVQLKKRDEMESIMKGLVCLASSTNSVFRFDLQHKKRIHVHVTTPLYPFLVVNIGSGVSILKATGPSSFVRITGTCIGGGTVLGLARLLFHAKTFKQVVKLSERGTDLLDLKVGDLFGDAAGSRCLPADTLASSFGRLYLMTFQEDGNLLRKNLRKEDIARSLIHMVSYNLGYLAYLVGTAHGVRRIFFAGKYINNHAFTMESITHGVNFYMRQYDAASSASIPACLNRCNSSLGGSAAASMAGDAAGTGCGPPQDRRGSSGCGPTHGDVGGLPPASSSSRENETTPFARRKISACFTQAEEQPRRKLRSLSAPPRMGVERWICSGRCVSFTSSTASRRKRSHPCGGRPSIATTPDGGGEQQLYREALDTARIRSDEGMGVTALRSIQGCMRLAGRASCSKPTNSSAEAGGETGKVSSCCNPPLVSVLAAQGVSRPHSCFCSPTKRLGEIGRIQDVLECDASIGWVRSTPGSAVLNTRPQQHIKPTLKYTAQRVSPSAAPSYPHPPPFEVLFLRHDGYLGALGALVASED
ncbi:fumble protein [Besnoitia besnoiti]|uniref:Fumble protein n=1 Tax=Besnoitia besnoiti TaxID=94643 RepID=A0A2A9MN59_BESBE|nr:fumble protein [Besnoitia besnoiti]PFH37606.1 fumble protein [Besnoitia besnoiti]